MGFGQGLSGLNAAAQELDVIGNNIANAGTVGFKSSSVTFSDVFANSQVGLGVKVASVNQRFTVGSISNTGNSLDLAIDGTKGLFRTEDTNGNVLYTRNGQFFADKDNFIVNAQGQRLTGFGLIGDDLQALTVPVGNLAPRASADVTTRANMDANANPVYETGVTEVLGNVFMSDDGGATYTEYQYRIGSTGQVSWFDTAATPNPVSLPDGNYTAANDAIGTNATAITLATTTGQAASPAGALGDSATVGTAYTAPIIAHPFSLTDPESYTHTLPLTVYDSVGNSHQMIQYFVKRPGGGGDSQWDVYYALDGNVVNAATPHEITYDTAGRLKTGTNANLVIPNPGGADAPADALELTFDYTGSTQFSGDFSYNFTQDGFPTGEYAGLSVDTDGSVIASYTNGELRTIGYVALANFNNLNGLKAFGDNSWIETGASGQPIVGRPGTNGLATIKGQAIEESNVDMSQELVNMIIAQRFYQANAQTIKTQDQIVQNLISMR